MATTQGTGEPAPHASPEGIGSVLDTDLYKLTMQCCVLKYFPNTQVTYKYTNRTPRMKFSHKAYTWLQAQIDSESCTSRERPTLLTIPVELVNVTLTDEEHAFLQKSCSYLNEPYLNYLKSFQFRPAEQVHLTFRVDSSARGANGEEVGDLDLHTEGLWLETILYEIPLLALISETYFKFMDTDWSYDGQEEKAHSKGERLIGGGAIFSEFGSRRRRDYHTHDLVLKGLTTAQKEGSGADATGKLTGTSNVHFAMKYGISPIGTVAHEWFMGVAAVTDNYEMANELALRYWVGTFGQGVLGIALTDTFGTADFLKAFAKRVPAFTTAQQGSVASTASMAATTTPSTETLSNTKAPIGAPRDEETSETPRYADVFTGTRQDSGDPKQFVATMRKYYDEQKITHKKTIVFSDSLDVEKCFEYKRACEEHGLQPSFGVGTFFTNDFTHTSTNAKSLPLNIVIKISSAEGHPAVKISDNIGKNTGDSEKVAEVKRRLGYVEKDWAAGDESKRWGAEGEKGV